MGLSLKRSAYPSTLTLSGELLLKDVRCLVREEIGVLTSLPLLRNVVHDLESARNNEECALTLYFTKESHIHTLVNLVLQSGLPIANRRIPELDYCVRSLSISLIICRSLIEVTLLVSHHLRVVRA